MEGLIDDVLEFSQSQPRANSRPEPISLVLVVHELLGRLERDPALPGWTPSVVQEPLGWCLGHRVILQQVILNLLINAVTFLSRPGVRPAVHIRFRRTRRRDPPVDFRQRNRHQPEVDRRARFRGVSSGSPPSAAYPAGGMGLSVARHGIGRTHGRVGVRHARRAAGTQFWIELPKVAGSTLSWNRLASRPSRTTSACAASRRARIEAMAAFIRAIELDSHLAERTAISETSCYNSVGLWNRWRRAAARWS